MASVTRPLAADAPAPSWLVAGLVAARPLGAASSAAAGGDRAGSELRSKPLLVSSLAAVCSARLAVPVVGCFEQLGTRPSPGLSPASRAAALSTRLRLRNDVEIPHATVLLVDDTWRTGWTATLATVLLRRGRFQDCRPARRAQTP